MDGSPGCSGVAKAARDGGPPRNPGGQEESTSVPEGRWKPLPEPGFHRLSVATSRADAYVLRIDPGCSGAAHWRCLRCMRTVRTHGKLRHVCATRGTPGVEG